MMRKKASMHLDQRYNLMIDNAYFLCNPPIGGTITKIERPPLHEYIRKLIFKDLNKTTVEKVISAKPASCVLYSAGLNCFWPAHIASSAY